MDRITMTQTLHAFILEKVLARPDFPLTSETSLVKSGLLDSFATLEIAIFMEEKFKVVLSDHELGEIDTLDQLVTAGLKQLT